jgi:hypothetical protein
MYQHGTIPIFELTQPKIKIDKKVLSSQGFYFIVQEINNK